VFRSGGHSFSYLLSSGRKEGKRTVGRLKKREKRKRRKRLARLAAGEKTPSSYPDRGKEKGGEGKKTCRPLEKRGGRGEGTLFFCACRREACRSNYCEGGGRLRRLGFELEGREKKAGRRLTLRWIGEGRTLSSEEEKKIAETGL